MTKKSALVYWASIVCFETAVLGLALLWRGIWGIWGMLLFGISVNVCYWSLGLNRRMMEEFRPLHIPVDVIAAGALVLGGHKCLAKLGILEPEARMLPLLSEFAALAVVALPFVAVAFNVRVDDRDYLPELWQKFKQIYIPVLTFYFMCFIYLPSETFIGNNSDFEFSYQMFIPHQWAVTIFGSLVTAAIIGMLDRKVSETAGALVFGLDLAVYVQYMFLNGKLMLLDGGSMDWGRYTADIVTGYVIWGVLLILPVILMHRKRQIWDKIRTGIPAALGGIQLLTLCSLLITAPEGVFELKLDDNDMSPREQFTLSAKDNVILLIWDAVDNAYLKELWETEPELFEGLEDFTMYTNTCSVFDATNTSITQMLTGMEFAVELPGQEWHETAWKSGRAVEFYDRLHAAGYTVNGYNLGGSTARNYEGKFDNYGRDGEESPDDIQVDRDGMHVKMNELIAYRALPMGMKRLINSADLSFSNIVTRKHRAYYGNREYMEHLQLVLSGTGKNYFVVDHLQGTHTPCPDTLEETRFLLGLLKEYIRQMKELGVYDDAAVIVTADHGKHNMYDPTRAATPILLVKEKGKHGGGLVLDNAPVYHEDMQATLLDCAGLYDKERDGEMFGTSIFDIGEDSLRERTWYNKRADPDYPKVDIMGSAGMQTRFNTYYSFTYTGDTAVLEEMVREGRYTRIYPMVDYKG